MPTCMCVYRPDDVIQELTIGATYQALNMTDSEILVLNNLNNVQWYPLYYFKFV